MAKDQKIIICLKTTNTMFILQIMYKYLNKILLNTSIPAESSVFESLSADDFGISDLKYIDSATEIILSYNMPFDSEHRQKFIWEFDVYIRYTLLKMQHFAKQLIQNIKFNQYTDKQKSLEIFLISGINNIINATKSIRGATYFKFNHSQLFLSLPSLSQLSLFSSSSELILVLIFLKNWYSLSLQFVYSSPNSQFQQSEKAIFLINDSASEEQKQIRIQQFRYFQYSYEGKQTMIIDFNTLDCSGNSYITITNFLRSKSISIQEKPSSLFKECVIKFTIFKTLKRGEKDIQYLIGFHRQLKDPIFIYFWEQNKGKLFQIVNTFIEQKISKYTSFYKYYQNKREQQIFKEYFNAEYEWILNYSIEKVGFYDKKYFDCLVRNILYTDDLFSSFIGNDDLFQRYLVLMPKVYTLIHHIIDNPSKYNYLKPDSRFNALNFAFNQNQCLSIWRKLIETQIIHQNILKMMRVLIQQVLKETLTKYFKQNPEWKLQLFKQNKLLLMRILKLKLYGLNYVENDIPVFKQLLQTPKFIFGEKIYDEFIDYFYKKSWLKEQIKSHFLGNIFYYGENEKFTEVKMFTLGERANNLVQKIDKFKNQRKSAQSLMQKYGCQNKTLNKCIFQNFQSILNQVIERGFKILSADVSEKADPNDFQLCARKLIQISSNSIYYHHQFSMRYFQITDMLGIIEDIVLRPHQKTLQVYAKLLSSGCFLQNLVYDGIFTYGQVEQFGLFLILKKIGVYLQYDEHKKQLIPQEELPKVQKTLTKLIQYLQKFTTILIQNFISSIFKQGMSPSQKIDAQIQFTSKLSEWNLFQKLRLQKKGEYPDLLEIQDLCEYLAKIISCQQTQIQKLIAKIYSSRIQSDVKIDTSGNDIQIFLHVISEVIKIYFWEPVDIQSHCVKRFRLNTILSQIKEKSLDSDNYFLLNHLMEIYQQYVNSLDYDLKQTVSQNSQIDQLLNLAFEVGKLNNFSRSFQNSIITFVEEIIQNSIKEKGRLEKLIPKTKNQITKQELIKKIKNISIDPLHHFVLRIFENINQLSTSSIEDFIKFANRCFKKYKKYPQIQILKYLTQNSFMKELKESKVNKKYELDFDKVKKSLQSLEGKMNGILIINKQFKLPLVEEYTQLLCCQELTKRPFQEKTLTLISNLKLQSLIKIFNFHINKLSILIQNPLTTVSKDELLWSIQLALHCQALITISYPHYRLDFQSFLQKLFSIYNVHNQLGDISMYLILQQISFDKYRWNLREIIVLFTKMYAKNNYYRLEEGEKGGFESSISFILASHQHEILQTLPAPYQKSQVFSEVINIIKQNKQLREEYKGNYDYLCKCIISARSNYTLSNLYLALINIININPWMRHCILKQLPFSQLFDHFQFSQGFLVSIVQQISFSPQQFYPFLDALISKIRTSLNNQDIMRGLINIANISIWNLCNIISENNYKKAVDYRITFRDIIHDIVKKSPLSRQYFEKITSYNIREALNSLACIQYKLKIFRKFKVYPLNWNKSQLGNSSNLFQRQPSNDGTHYDLSQIPKQQTYLSLFDKGQFKALFDTSTNVKAPDVNLIQIKPDLHYLYWYQFGIRADTNRKPEQIVKMPFQDLTYGNGNQQQEKQEEKETQEEKNYEGQQHLDENSQTKIVQGLQTNLVKKQSQQELDEQFTDTVDSHKPYTQIQSKVLIKYINLDREQFMKSQDKCEYLNLKIKQVVTSKRKIFKKLLIASQYLNMNGKQYKPDLKEAEAMMNKEAKILSKLHLRVFNLLRQNQILGELNLKHSVIKLINNKEDQSQDGSQQDSSHELQNMQPAEVIIQGSAENNQQQNILVQDVKPQQKIMDKINHQQQSTAQKTETNNNQEATIQRSKSTDSKLNTQQNQKLEQGPKQTQQLINNFQEPSIQNPIQLKDQKIQKKNTSENISENTILNKNLLISKYVSSVQLYQQIEQLPDQVICYLLYAHLQQKRVKDYRYSISGKNNYLKYCNLLMRLLVDVIKRTNVVDKSLFVFNDSNSPFVIAAQIIRQVQNLSKLYDYIFMDTNSKQFSLATYQSQTHKKTKNHKIVQFNPVTIFALPEKNYEYITLMKQIVLLADHDSGDLQSFMVSYFQTIIDQVKRSTYVFYSQEKSVPEILSQVVVQFVKLSQQTLNLTESMVYQTKQIKFPDNMLQLYGGLLEAAVGFTIILYKKLTLNLKTMKQTNTFTVNKKSYLQKNSRFSIESGSIINYLIKDISEKPWFDSKIFIQVYQDKIILLINVILQYRKLYYEITKQDPQTLILDSFEKDLLLKESLRKLRKNTGNCENKTKQLLSNKTSSIMDQATQQATILSKIDRMLLQFIQMHGPRTLDKCGSFFSLAPEILEHYSYDSKVLIYTKYLFGEEEEQIEILIDRNEVIISTLQELIKYDLNRQRKSSLSIKFVDQIGIDGGGLMSQYIQLFVSQLIDCRYGLFTRTEQGHLVPSRFANNVINHQRIFRLVGRLIGKCVGSNLLSTSVQFQKYIIKLFYGKNVGSLDDLLSVDSKLHANFKWILENDVSDMELTFQVPNVVFGQTTSIQLIQDGKNISLTNQNKQLYVDKYIHWILIGSIKSPLYELILGFSQMYPSDYIRSFFSLSELQSHIIGEPYFDLELYRKQVKYKNCDSSTQQVSWLFEILRQMTRQELMEYLSFLTGKRRLTSLDFGQFTIGLNLGNDALPVSNTCSNKLNLGLYKSKQILKYKLNQAIKQTQGFHIY